MATRWTRNLIPAIPDDDIRSADYNANFNTCRDSFLLLETDVDNMKLATDKNIADIIGMSTSITTMGSDINTLKIDSEKAKTDIATIKSVNSGYTLDINNVKNDVASQAGQISTIQSSITTINNSITTIENVQNSQVAPASYIDEFDGTSLHWSWMTRNSTVTVADGSVTVTGNNNATFDVSPVAYISCEGSVSLQTKLISTSSQAPKYLGGIFVTDKEDGTGTGFIFGPAKNTTINGGLMVSNLTGTTFFSNATVQPFPLFLRVTAAYKNFCFEYSADGTTWNTAFTTTDSSIATGARFFAGITAFSLEGTYYTSMVFDRFEKSPYLGPR